MSVQIVPCPVSKSITHVAIALDSMEFGVSATFAADSFTEAGELFKRDRVLMAGDAYAAWNSDDDYAIEFVLSALGYTKAAAPVAE